MKFSPLFLRTLLCLYCYQHRQYADAFYTIQPYRVIRNNPSLSSSPSSIPLVIPRHKRTFLPTTTTSTSTSTPTSTSTRKATISHENANLETDEYHRNLHVNEVNVRHGTKIGLIYDPAQERFVDIHTATEHQATSTAKRKRKRLAIQQYVKQTIFNSFVPEGITPNYYTFIKWRVVQRFLSANVNVFGTQSLLMGLGIKSTKSSSVLGLSAALNWVLKDALGKIVRMVWASKMGRKFDPDAKRWRFRSSLLYAIGNGFEVLTYVFPSLFLVLATSANSLKQMSMLTSSSTRNAVYNSFASKENIGDITAKGEAQIAFVDLFGIASGILLSSKFKQ